MNRTFKHFLTEARIQAPNTLRTQVMNVAASALFSLAYSQEGGMDEGMRAFMTQMKKKYGNFRVFKLSEGQPLVVTLNFDPKELPERYTKGIRLQKTYPIKVRVGALGATDDQHMAEYNSMGRGQSGGITINLSNLPEIDAIGSVEGMEAALDNLEGSVAHEVQHATQDVVLRKRHASQFELPKEGDTDDDYYASQVEFQPQITTAGNDFKRMLKQVRNAGVEVSGEAAQQLFKVFVGASNTMPQGMLKWKSYFDSPFYKSLRQNDTDKWKKAVKELHRLLYPKL